MALAVANSKKHGRLIAYVCLCWISAIGFGLACTGRKDEQADTKALFFQFADLLRKTSDVNSGDSSGDDLLMKSEKRLRSNPDVELWLTQLDSSRSERREAALYLLGTIWPESRVAGLWVVFADDASIDVRGFCVSRLAKSLDNRAIRATLWLLGSSDYGDVLYGLFIVRKNSRRLDDQFIAACSRRILASGILTDRRRASSAVVTLAKLCLRSRVFTSKDDIAVANRIVQSSHTSGADAP